MTAATPTDALLRYLSLAREAVLWKLDGLDEYDLRRPLTPTGTNLLGIVKHLAFVEFGYFGETFGRTPSVSLAIDFEADPNVDMYATAAETVDDVFSFYNEAAQNTTSAIIELGLAAEGHVPWWGEDANPVTMHTVAIHMLAETQRHLGHIDILREQLDGAAGYRATASNLVSDDPADWEPYVRALQAIAEASR